MRASTPTIEQQNVRPDADMPRNCCISLHDRSALSATRGPQSRCHSSVTASSKSVQGGPGRPMRKCPDHRDDGRPRRSPTKPCGREADLERPVAGFPRRGVDHTPGIRGFRRRHHRLPQRRQPRAGVHGSVGRVWARSSMRNDGTLWATDDVSAVECHTTVPLGCPDDEPTGECD